MTAQTINVGPKTNITELVAHIKVIVGETHTFPLNLVTKILIATVKRGITKNTKKYGFQKYSQLIVILLPPLPCHSKKALGIITIFSIRSLL